MPAAKTGCGHFNFRVFVPAIFGGNVVCNGPGPVVLECRNAVYPTLFSAIRMLPVTGFDGLGWHGCCTINYELH